MGQDLIRPKRYPRTSGTQTLPEKPKDCSECSDRRKRPLRSTAVNTDSSPSTAEPPKKAAKESFNVDVYGKSSLTAKRSAKSGFCAGIDYLPHSSMGRELDGLFGCHSSALPTCVDCDKRKSLQTATVGLNTDIARSRDYGCDPMPQPKPK